MAILSLMPWERVGNKRRHPPTQAKSTEPAGIKKVKIYEYSIWTVAILMRCFTPISTPGDAQDRLV
jgi:hypothetical protein